MCTNIKFALKQPTIDVISAQPILHVGLKLASGSKVLVYLVASSANESGFVSCSVSNPVPDSAESSSLTIEKILRKNYISQLLKKFSQYYIYRGNQNSLLVWYSIRRQ